MSNHTGSQALAALRRTLSPFLMEGDTQGASRRRPESKQLSGGQK